MYLTCWCMLSTTCHSSLSVRPRSAIGLIKSLLQIARRAEIGRSECQSVLSLEVLSVRLVQGNNLDRACQESDVIVRIGTSFCNVTSLSRVQLTCRPPTDQPPAQDKNGNPDRGQIPQVVVSPRFFL